MQKDDLSHLPVGSKLERVGGFAYVSLYPFHQEPVVMSLGFGALQTYPTSWLCHCVSQKLPQQCCVINQPRAQWLTTVSAYAHAPESTGWLWAREPGLSRVGVLRAAGGAQVCRSVSIPGLRLTGHSSLGKAPLLAMAGVGGASPVGSAHFESFLLWRLFIPHCPLPDGQGSANMCSIMQ